MRVDNSIYDKRMKVSVGVGESADSDDVVPSIPPCPCV